MDIINVKHTDSGYIVNNQFFVPKDKNNNDYKDIQSWVKKGNKIETQYIKSSELLKQEYNDNVNLEANRRIISNYPDYKQRNIDREALLYPDDSLKRNIQIDMHNHIIFIIDKARELKLSISKLSTKELLSLDVTLDTHWI